MAVGRGEAECAPVARGEVAAAVRAVRIRRLGDEADVAELGRQHVTAHDALGILQVLRVPGPAQDQGGLDDVAGVVDFATVR